jgi:hypothetical protein
MLGRMAVNPAPTIIDVPSIDRRESERVIEMPSLHGDLHRAFRRRQIHLASN